MITALEVMMTRENSFYHGTQFLQHYDMIQESLYLCFKKIHGLI
nr:MAG TPA: hypothetical protein [Bacteriophage sp.]